MTAYRFAFPFIFIVLLQICLAATNGSARVAVRLEPYNDLICSGGRTAETRGLDDYMVRVEYRLLYSVNVLL